MPDKQPGLHRQVSYAQRKSDNIGEERHAGVRKEEFAPHREQLWMQNFLYSRQIDFRILGKGMVSLHQQGAHGQREQPKEISVLYLSEITRWVQSQPAAGLPLTCASVPRPRTPCKKPPAPHTAGQSAPVIILRVRQIIDDGEKYKTSRYGMAMAESMRQAQP